MILTAALGPCADDQPPPVSFLEKNDPTMDTLFLSENTPEICFAVDSNLLNNPPEWVAFEVDAIENPKEVPFVVSLFLEKTGKPGPEYRLPFGFFVLYPPDQPARQRFRFDQTARQLRKICGARDSTHQFQIRLSAAPNDTILGLSGLRFRVRGPRFGD